MIFKQLKYSMLLFIVFNTSAQVLNVPQNIQEYDQWCWAGVSKSVLAYYGFTKSQCEIAEYVREVNNGSSFGTVDCCADPNKGCNNPNYLYGGPGSIQDILAHFGSIQNYGIGTIISLDQVKTEISAGRPFIARWGWYSGGGHFVVGHGVAGNNIYYMNPWFGEGLHLSTYDWLVDDGNHIWTHTELITTNLGVEYFKTNPDFSVYPNPAENLIHININSLKKAELFDLTGRLISTTTSSELDLSNVKSAMYLMNIYTEDGLIISKKIIKR